MKPVVAKILGLSSGHQEEPTELTNHVTLQPAAAAPVDGNIPASQRK